MRVEDWDISVLYDSPNISTSRTSLVRGDDTYTSREEAEVVSVSHNFQSLKIKISAHTYVLKYDTAHSSEMSPLSIKSAMGSSLISNPDRFLLGGLSIM